jgi:hypothetical protein
MPDNGEQLAQYMCHFENSQDKTIFRFFQRDHSLLKNHFTIFAGAGLNRE